jgi:hypothetical protein
MTRKLIFQYNKNHMFNLHTLSDITFLGSEKKLPFCSKSCYLSISSIIGNFPYKFLVRRGNWKICSVNIIVKQFWRHFCEVSWGPKTKLHTVVKISAWSYRRFVQYRAPRARQLLLIPCIHLDSGLSYQKKKKKLCLFNFT